MSRPEYDLNKIKFSSGNPLWERAVQLYERGSVTRFEDNDGSYAARVMGGNPYDVWVSAARFDIGNCSCYLGQNDALCKHMVAVAIHAVTGGASLLEKDRRLLSSPVCSAILGSLSADDMKAMKAGVATTMRYIKPYRGPSRTWFANQNSLAEGCTRLAAIFSELPVCPETAQVVVQTLLRLDKKLSRGGVDDSDGTVGGFIEESVVMLVDFAKRDPQCIRTFTVLQDRETCFDWQDPLLALLSD